MAVAFLTLVLRFLLSSFETLLKKRGSFSFVLYASQFSRKFRRSFCYIKQGCPKIHGTSWKSLLSSRNPLTAIPFDDFRQISIIRKCQKNHVLYVLSYNSYNILINKIIHPRVNLHIKSSYINIILCRSKTIIFNCIWAQIRL